LRRVLDHGGCAKSGVFAVDQLTRGLQPVAGESRFALRGRAVDFPSAAGLHSATDVQWGLHPAGTSAPSASSCRERPNDTGSALCVSAGALGSVLRSRTSVALLAGATDAVARLIHARFDAATRSEAFLAAPRVRLCQGRRGSDPC